MIQITEKSQNCLLTYALVIYASSVKRTAAVASASDNASQTFADFATSAIVISATERFANTRIQIAAFVTEAAVVGRANRLARAFLAN